MGTALAGTAPWLIPRSRADQNISGFRPYVNYSNMLY